MSNPEFVINVLIPAAVVVLVLFIAFEFWNYRVRQKQWREQIESLTYQRDEYQAELNGAGKHTTGEWREIAFHHARENRAVRKQLADNQEAYEHKLLELGLRAAQFRALVVAIWGEPPLDRSMKNVIEYIRLLQGRIGEDAVKKHGLAHAYEEISRRLQSAGAENQARNEELERLRAGAEEASENFVWLINSGLGINMEGRGVYVMAVQTTGIPIGFGWNIVEAIQDARLKMRRTEEGLSS